VIDIDSLHRPDVIELVLLVLFVLVASIGAFVGMRQDLIASGLQYELGKLF
jgi:prepilin signal peptidase PulO-like enzyme (type II secretory pathway)